MKEEATTIHWDCPVQSFFPESMEEGLLQVKRFILHLTDDEELAGWKKIKTCLIVVKMSVHFRTCQKMLEHVR